MSETPAKPVNSLGFLIYLVVTAILCGALIMVVEVLGSRVIGPFFGISLFVWTSLITVTLISLATSHPPARVPVARVEGSSPLRCAAEPGRM